MISYLTFFDELEKIAEEERKFVNKGRLKRLLLATGATAAGAGLGHATGELFRRKVGPRLLEAGRGLPKSTVAKYGPAVAGGLTAGAGALAMLHRRKTDRYIDEGQRPK